MKKFLCITMLINAIWSTNGFAQENCTNPLPPVLSKVTVQPETGNTVLNWTLSPSKEVAAYIIFFYSYDTSNRGDSITTIWDSLATSYILTSPVSKYYSASYVVQSYRLPKVAGKDGCWSIFSNVLSSIFAEASIDTCNNKINVKWNKYNSYPEEVTDYSVLVSVNGNPFTEASKISPALDNYTMHDYITEAEYCFVVRANLADGSTSTSNKICLLTNTQRPPGWINADRATVTSDNNILLDFTVDPLSEISLFRLEKKAGTSGTFQQLAQITSNSGLITYTDDKADINSVNYYRLSAINNCNIPITTSNISSNIVLKYAQDGDDIHLSWNSYKKWLGTISSYKLFVDLGNGYFEKLTLQPNDTVCTIGYKEIMYDVTSGKFCFYISAEEISNPYGITGESNSSIVCSEPTELITVPNMFTPDNDLINDLFKPVLSFIPIDYQLIISNRNGHVIFETRDFNSVWDGSFNGSLQAQGVYLWFIKLTTPSGKTLSKTGTVTIYRNR